MGLIGLIGLIHPSARASPLLSPFVKTSGFLFMLVSRDGGGGGRHLPPPIFLVKFEGKYKHVKN
jgi:hypothetical protein